MDEIRTITEDKFRKSTKKKTCLILNAQPLRESIKCYKTQEVAPCKKIWKFVYNFKVYSPAAPAVPEQGILQVAVSLGWRDDFETHSSQS